MVAIKVCSIKRPFGKKSYHIEIGQMICKASNLLVSICYDFLLKAISEQTGFLHRYAYFYEKK